MAEAMAATLVQNGSRREVSLAVFLSEQLQRPRREVIAAIFATGVPVLGFTAADISAVLQSLELTDKP